MSWSLFRSVALLSSPSCLLHLRRAKAKQAPRLTRPCQVLFSKKVDLFFLPFGRSARGYKPVTVKTWVLFKSVRQQIGNHPSAATRVNVRHGCCHNFKMLPSHFLTFIISFTIQPTGHIKHRASIYIKVSLFISKPFQLQGCGLAFDFPLAAARRPVAGAESQEPET